MKHNVILEVTFTRIWAKAVETIALSISRVCVCVCVCVCVRVHAGMCGHAHTHTHIHGHIREMTQLTREYAQGMITPNLYHMKRLQAPDWCRMKLCDCALSQGQLSAMAAHSVQGR